MNDMKHEDQNYKLAAFVNIHSSEARRRVGLREPVERRWLDDLRQYHATYDSKTLDEIRGKEGSEIFMSLTRPKTDALTARMYDLLFPTDDRNWEIKPTPVPQFQRQTEQISRVIAEGQKTVADRQANMIAEADAIPYGEEPGPAAQQAAQDMQAAQDVLTEAEEALEALQELNVEANDRCKLMETEIHDQLVESDWPTVARDMLDDGGKVGIGVCKGPVVGTSVSQRWVLDENQKDYELRHVVNESPEVEYVDYWSFFPDPDVKHHQNGRGTYQRHLMNDKQLRMMAHRDDIDAEAVRKLLELKPDRDLPWYVDHLRNMSDEQQNSVGPLYQVWEYTGPVSGEDLRTLHDAKGNKAAGLLLKDGHIDLLQEINIRMLFCQGILMSFEMHPLDSQETLYSSYCPDEDEYSPYGYGTPYKIRNAQAMLNGAARMLMDNSSLTAGPQIEINPEILEPVNGEWVFRGTKMWWRDPEADPNEPGMREYNFTGHHNELLSILNIAKELIDEESGITKLAEGEQGTGTTKTAQGMAILMNSMNVIYRRYVKAWDDQVTKPLIRRFYHWNMQFSEKNELKGDYEVDARGASVLLVREMQASNLMALAQVFMDHPKLGIWIKDEGMIQEIFRAHMIPTASILRTQTEVTQEEQRLAAQPSPEAMAMQQENELKHADIEARKEIAHVSSDARIRVAQLEHESNMMELAMKENTTLQSIQAQLETAREKEAAKERIENRKIDASKDKLNVEVAMAERTGKNSGGSI